MDLVKIAGVTEWPAPTNKKEVQSFLGFTNFYRRFVWDFSELVLESSVWSGLLPFLGETGTRTSPSKTKTFAKPH